MPVAKHFPGLGDTLADSHEILPLAQSGDPHREADLLPFRQAVAAGVPMVMTAHLPVPRGTRPATLSPVALQEWLRRKLGFQGVIITDDLEMGGITTNGCRRPRGPAGPGGGGRPPAHLQRLGRGLGHRPPPGLDPNLAPRGREAAARLQFLRQALPPQGRSKAVRILPRRRSERYRRGRSDRQ